MKKVLISAFAAAAVLSTGSAFANDLVSEDPFFNNPAAQVEQLSVASTSDAKASAESSIFDAAFGSQDPR